jgi:pimeloyl-ACP methyl ester carboxylesterase
MFRTHCPPTKHLSRRRNRFRMFSLVPLVLALLAPFVFANPGKFSAQSGMNTPASPKPSVVLVPGAYEDGSIWTRVVGLLEAKGFQVAVVPIPLTSLAADAAMTRNVLAAQPGTTILVGHSWGGVVITEAGNAPNVSALVYIAAVAPDVGEASGEVLQRCPKHSPLPIHTDATGMKWLDPAAFPEVWATDLDNAEARILAATQRPIATTSFTDRVTQAAWHTKPAWFQVSANDIVQCPEVQRFMAKRMGATTIELSASHASPLSRPKEVTMLIMDAAEKTMARELGHRGY